MDNEWEFGEVNYIPDKTQIDHMQEDVRDWISGILPQRDPAKTAIKLVTEAAELLDSVANRGDYSESSGEIADVFILLLDIADQVGVDIATAFEKKMSINWDRNWEVKNGSLRHN